jgi:hypothetical protein
MSLKVSTDLLGAEVKARRPKYTIHLIVNEHKVTTISLPGWSGISGTLLVDLWALQDFLSAIPDDCPPAQVLLWRQQMRTVILAFALGLALAASAQAAPLSSRPTGIELRAAPLFELVRDDCGRGWHRTRWRDQWGNWQWGHCIPNGGSHDAWTAGWSHPYPDWRAEPPR